MIPNDFYRQIVDVLPILCVDLIIIKDGKYLLVKRKNKPFKGIYWSPGGRVLKGEKITRAIYRIAMQEVGLKVKVISFAGFYEGFYKENEQKVAISHTVSLTFICSPITNKVKVDRQSIDFKWSNHLPKQLTLYLPYLPLH